MEISKTMSEEKFKQQTTKFIWFCLSIITIMWFYFYNSNLESEYKAKVEVQKIQSSYSAEVDFWKYKYYECEKLAGKAQPPAQK